MQILGMRQSNGTTSTWNNKKYSCCLYEYVTTYVTKVVMKKGKMEKLKAKGMMGTTDLSRHSVWNASDIQRGI